MTDPATPTDCSDLPTREDVQELREAIESLRDHVQIVWHAIDEVRDVINQALTPDSPDIWTVEPSEGFPLGRYRPFAGFDPVTEWNAAQAAPVEPLPVLETDAVRLRESQGQGVDSLADTHRHNGSNCDTPQQNTQATQQRDLWGDDAEAALAERTAAKAASAVPAEYTPQKETEPAGESYTLDDWLAFRHAFSDDQVDAAGIRREFTRLQASKRPFIE